MYLILQNPYFKNRLGKVRWSNFCESLDKKFKQLIQKKKTVDDLECVTKSNKLRS